MVGRMIMAVHTLIYSDDAPATRAFLKDVLGLPFVSDGEQSSDPESWLIFGTGPSELGVHPTQGQHGAESFTAPRHHQVSLLVDDIDATVATIRERGGEVSDPVDMRFGIGSEVQVPGADAILVYAPKHVTAYDRT
jgi:catechol 2,3-dioxygenase-like lactoylglutathione lyase family enzyme